jgi:hypothetical protein
MATDLTEQTKLIFPNEPAKVTISLGYDTTDSIAMDDFEAELPVELVGKIRTIYDELIILRERLEPLGIKIRVLEFFDEASWINEENWGQITDDFGQVDGVQYSVFSGGNVYMTLHAKHYAGQLEFSITPIEDVENEDV